MRLLIDDDSTCSKDRACAQQPDKTHFHAFAKVAVPVQEWPMEAGASLEIPNNRRTLEK